MIAAIAAVLFGFQAMDLTPTDDVWVYPHASDPARDEYLRVWGVGGQSVADDPAFAADFSYSYLKWDLTGVPKDRKLLEARLVLTHIANPSFDLATANAKPLEARPLASTFSEKQWAFDKSAKIAPLKGDKASFGVSKVGAMPAEGKEFKIEIDLLKGPNDFASTLKGSGTSLELALVSRMDPAETEVRSTYKLFSKDAEKPDRRPVLRLVFERP